MAYPSTIDSFTNPVGTNTLDNPDHATQHVNVNTAVNSIETVLGTNSGTSVLKNFTAGDLASKKNNETYGTPTFTLGSDTIGDTFFRSAGGTINRLAVGAQGAALTSTGTLATWSGKGVYSAVAGVTNGDISVTGSGYTAVATATYTAIVPSILYITAGASFKENDAGGNQTIMKLTVGGTTVFQTTAKTASTNDQIGIAGAGTIAVATGAGSILMQANVQAGAGTVIYQNTHCTIGALVLSQ